MQFDIRSNVSEVIRAVDEVQAKQIPFALVLAMTLTAKEVKPAEIDVMNKVFDRPTPYSLNALQVKPATKGNPVASVQFKEGLTSRTDAKRFLNPEVHGGPRSHKSSEIRLARLLGGASYMVPAHDAPLNSYGNLTGGFYRRILSQLKSADHAFAEATNSKRSKGNRKSSAFFIPKKGGAIYERRGKMVKPVLIAVKAPTYTKRFPFYETGERVLAARIGPNFDIAFERAMANSAYKSLRGEKWRH